MKILFVVGSCLRVNTSANLCHLAYINGCVKEGHDVDVISMSELGCAIDTSIKLPQVSNWYTYAPPIHNNSSRTTAEALEKKKNGGFFQTIKKHVKTFILKFYGIYGRTAYIWVNKAKKFSSDTYYDYMISLATPYVSHYLSLLLKKNGNIKFNKWIQIWEDPWATDLYNLSGNKKIEKEEKKLLAGADKVIYVSPLTLKYQKDIYPEHQKKMAWIPLPYYYKNEESRVFKENNYRFGYFGDYFSFSRDLMPFYEAAKKEKIEANIYGNSDLKLEETNLIHVHPRVGLDELATAEAQTDVLVFLCNLKGGQIPGKLYQYSATDKKILFILDGTEEEISVLRNYFSQFNRYIFCHNTIEDISRGIKLIKNEKDIESCCCVEVFSPENIIKEIFKTC